MSLERPVGCAEEALENIDPRPLLPRFSRGLTSAWRSPPATERKAHRLDPVRGFEGLSAAHMDL